MQEIRNVPTERLGQVVEGFAYSGFDTIECDRQPDGRWTVTAS